MDKPIYNRVLLKLGGESLAAENGGFGIDQEALNSIASEVAEAKNFEVTIHAEFQ